MPDLLVNYGQLVIAGALAVSTIVLGILNYNRNTRINALEAKVQYLKRRIHRVSSKVDPEADRKLVLEATKSIQILGINSLGPIHHCREEIIGFLRDKEGLLRVVLLNPTSDAFKHREQKEQDQAGRLRSEWLASVSILKDILRHSNGKIVLRLRSDPPDRALLIIDSEDSLSEQSRMLINYYPDEPGMRGYSGSQYLAEFTMERDRDSMFKNAEFYARVWANAQELNLHEASLLVERKS